jgi:hypothetical protein
MRMKMAGHPGDWVRESEAKPLIKRTPLIAV